MLRRAFVSCLGLVFVAGLLEAQPKPSSDLLLPYFEVDLEGGEATTVFAVINALDRQVDVAAALYTNWGLPVLSTQLRLKPREVWAGDLNEWLVEGKVPGRKPLTAGEIQLVQAMLSGQPSPVNGLYYSTDVAFGRATGYLTLRTLGSTGKGKAAKPDALRGEGFVVDPEQGPARGHDLVDIDKTTSQELCTRHKLRHLAGIGLAEAQVIVWRDLAGQTLPAPVPADRRRQVEVSVYSPQGKLLLTQPFKLLPSEQVPIVELGLTEPLGRIEIATTDASVAIVQATEGGPSFETACVQGSGGPGPDPKPSAIQIVTLANGQDANAPPGASVPVGATVNWSYRVTNSGSDALTQISVTDSQGLQVTCPKNSLNAGQSMTCSAKTLATACQHKTVGTVTAKMKQGKKGGGGTVTAQDPSHYFGEEGADVEIVVSTNGADANVPTGPSVLAGSPITWTYLVTNTGKVRLLSLRLEDDHGAAVVCPRTSLGPGEAMTCEATGVAGAGQFKNVGKVTGTATCGPVSDSDPSHYFGESKKDVELRALTNGFDADFPPGPSIPVGSPVTWEYIVTNTGKFALNALAVTDDKGTAVSCPKTGLAAGESMTCIARGVAMSCQYSAYATATGQTPDGARVSASNPSNYFGQAEASILIKTAVNGMDADLPPGPSVPIGTPVQWTYTLTNTGKVALSGLAVTDDKGAPVACPRTDLRPGETISCSASGTAVSGDFRSVGSVTANPPCGDPVRDDDPSHYRGVGDPGIRIQTLVNQQDANLPPGPTIQVGSPVSWKYVVTNSGQFALNNVQVSDSRGASVTCPKTTLGLGEAMTCTAGGTAKACQFDNLGTATGNTSAGQLVTAVDPSYYVGEHHPGIKIKTAVNNVEADAPPGPAIMVGAPVSWTYTVTNLGDAPVSNLQVTDDQGAAVSCPKTTLQPGESTVCNASGFAKEGQFRNVGTATAAPPCGAAVSAQDPSHYKGGGNGAISIQTFANGQDANNPPGPSVPIGGPVAWTYTVKNLGLVALSNVTVIDNRGATVSCPKAALQPNEQMTCTAAGTAKACQNDNLGTAAAQTSDGAQVAATDPSNYYGQPQPGLGFELSVNGQDADVAPGPAITVGTPVTWVYAVTNTGNVTLSNLSAGDNKGTAVNCPKTTLQPGEVMSCYAFGTAAEGAFSNLGTVTATPACGTAISANDPSNYFGGGSSELQIRTLVNFQDVGSPPGPSIPTGSTITWNYIVKNLGQVSLSQLEAGELNGPLAACPKTTLAPGESVTCTATSNAAACQNTHVGGATARNTSNPNQVVELSAIDATFYTGTFTPKLQLETAVNGNAADAAPGLTVPYGSEVTWTYTVVNTSPVNMSNVKVVDDQGAAVSCPQTSLDAGDSMECQASAIAGEGLFKNVGSVTADPPCGSSVSAQDPSYYFGEVVVAVTLRKLTNGQDATAAPGPSIPLGASVTWTYEVQNTGNISLASVSVTDDKVGSVTCPKSALAPQESMTCTASGTAQACQYQNKGTVIATSSNGKTATADDLSWYFGSASASLAIDARVNGNIADTPTGPVFRTGAQVSWTFAVKNTGQVPLTGVTVTTALSLTVSCPKTDLQPQEEMTCTATSTALAGQQSNLATASGQPSPCGNPVSAQNHAYYKGPPVIELGTTNQFVPIWNDLGSGADLDGGFWRPLPTNGFYILGDYGQGNYNPPSLSVKTIRVASDDEVGSPGLAAPIDYQWIWDDSGSGADKDGSVWRPIPPTDYVCVGHVFVEGYNKPNTSNSPGLDKYRCLRSDLAMQVTESLALTWDDKGSGANDDVSVYRLPDGLNVIFAHGAYDQPVQTFHIPRSLR